MSVSCSLAKPIRGFPLESVTEIMSGTARGRGFALGTLAVVVDKGVVAAGAGVAGALGLAASGLVLFIGWSEASDCPKEVTEQRSIRINATLCNLHFIKPSA